MTNDPFGSLNAVIARSLPCSRANAAALATKRASSGVVAILSGDMDGFMPFVVGTGIGVPTGVPAFDPSVPVHPAARIAAIRSKVTGSRCLISMQYGSVPLGKRIVKSGGEFQGQIPFTVSWHR